MNMEIVQLVNEYNVSNRKADFDFYRRFFEIAKRTFGLDGYLNELVFIPREDHMNPKYEKYTKGFAGLFGQAAYEHATGNLIIYDRNIEWGKFNEMRMDKVPDSENQIVLYNLMVLQTLLHEVEHAKQHKLKAEGQDVESELIRIVDTDKGETNESYEYSLTERLAEMRSIGQILDMYQYLGIDNHFIYQYFEKRFRQESIRGYHFIDENGYKTETETDVLFAPTVKYANLKEADIVQLSELAISVEGEDRIIYGLPISIEEYKELCDTVDSYKI